MTRPSARVLVLGANGRLGRMLQRHWPVAGALALAPLWQVRTGAARGDTLVFDPLQDVPACAPVDVVLGLAGIVPGKGDLGLNTDLAYAAVRLGADLGARQVFVTSSAAVYGGGDVAFVETSPLAPQSPYGQAKAAMEDAALALGARLSVPVCALRIGNVAGADALLAAAGQARVLDRFADGQGPRRSYIGPAALADILAQLMGQGGLPAVLNVALDGPVAMADLCAQAGLAVTWRPAPATALACVVQDVRRLSGLVPVAHADAGQIVADWRADQALIRG